jgi:hypothetical protein
MSRFKLFGIMTAMLAAITSDRKLTSEEKTKQSNTLNRQAGGMLFSTGFNSGRKLNQRQIRKRRRQNPHSSKWQ